MQTVTSDPTPELELRLLGPLELWRSGTRTPLPRSKKTRALLAYLAIVGRPVRRDRLCALLWDVTDDPRGALRWSLSRLRQVLGEAQCIEANREEVVFRSEGVRVDAEQLSRAVRAGADTLDTSELVALAALTRGTFLEGLELTDFLDFNAWCVAERERFREEQCTLLAELVGRLRDEPEAALPHARQRAQRDSFNLAAQRELLELLVRAGKLAEARQRFDNARRLYREVGANGLFQLEEAWGELSSRGGHSGPAAPPAPLAPTPKTESEQPTPALWPFTGRKKELALLERLLGELGAGAPARALLVTGEPGSGKSRLAERLTARATSAGFNVLSGRAYEAESTRPYGPWMDALGIHVHELLAAPGGEVSASTREALFSAVAERLAGGAEGHTGVLLVLDDLQWLDRDSAELLHFILRSYRQGPLFILLLARGGELSDNEPALRALRSLRRESRLEEVELEPLSETEIAALVAGQSGVDATAIYRASAGNPLYAIELARARSTGVEDTPATLLELVRERIEQLPDAAADVLRWGAVLGHTIDIERLEALSSLELDDLVRALEHLEHHALLHIDATRMRQRYTFSHDVVREVVYADLSHPRRRLMHRKVALLLQPQISSADVATDVAHHAGLAGEAQLGVEACLVAGNQSLRLFANGDAEALAKRGLRLAAELEPTERIEATLDLLRIQFAARTPERDQAAIQVRELAERALDLGLTRAARLGFQMLSFLRWESSSMADALDNIMQAERVSRSADPDERAAALAQAAKCLVLLERNMGQAEAFVMEAEALAQRGGLSTSAVSFATGMIAAHRGELDAAIQAFAEARQLARQHGERLAEFCAVEHWVMLEIDRGNHSAALELAEGLVELGDRVRAGAEAPTAKALLALVRVLSGEAQPGSPLTEAIEQLRLLDAKYELSFLLTRWAEHALNAGHVPEAKARARDALEIAHAIGRPSETALAHVVLARAGEHAQEPEARQRHLAELERLSQGELSRAARQRLDAIHS